MSIFDRSLTDTFGGGGAAGGGGGFMNNTFSSPAGAKADKGVSSCLLSNPSRASKRRLSMLKRKLEEKSLHFLLSSLRREIYLRKIAKIFTYFQKFLN